MAGYPYDGATGALTPKARGVFAGWIRAALRRPGADELGETIGRVVIRNIRHDGGMMVSDFSSFLGTLTGATRDGAIWSDTAYAVLAYQNCCYSHQRLGPPAMAPLKLWHVIPESHLRDAINIANGRAPGSSSDVWILFQDAYARDDRDAIYGIIEEARMHPRGFQVFATFPPSDHVPDAWERVDDWTSAAEACAALGLSIDWPGYTKGSHLWILSYQMDVVVSVHVPTCGDAGWNSIFRPSTTRSVGYGQTLVLGPLKSVVPSDRGMPEVVHNSPLLFRTAPSGGGPAAILLNVRDLGEHAGW